MPELTDISTGGEGAEMLLFLYKYLSQSTKEQLCLIKARFIVLTGQFENCTLDFWKKSSYDVFVKQIK